MAFIDDFEVSTDSGMQAAYVTNAVEVVDQQNTTVNSSPEFGNPGGTAQWRWAQSFKLSGKTIITAVEIKQGDVGYGSPTGNWTLRIETDNAGSPSGTLANANASKVVSPPGVNTIIKGTFDSSFNLVSNTTYWIVVQCNNQADTNVWRLSRNSNSSYADGDSKLSQNGGTSWGAGSGDLYFKVYTLALQSYSEATIKTQGSYALKAVAAITDSLNKTLTKTF